MKNHLITMLLALLLAGCGAGPTITAVNVGATPMAIEPGATALLSANISGTGNFSNAVNWSIVSGGGSLSAESGASVIYTASGVASGTDVVIKATSTANNTKSGEATVKVLAKPAIASFNSDTLVLGGGGGNIKLSWNVTGADTLSIDQGVGTVTGSEKSVTINKTTTYTLTATNAVGSVSATRVITVTALGIQDWKKQLGTTADDKAQGVATDSNGNVFMAGYTRGAFVVGSNTGPFDAYLIKFSPQGTMQWTKQLGSNADDQVFSAATDQGGNVLIAGTTQGALGSKHEGLEDAFVVKFDGGGNEVWRKQIGTTANDFAWSVATDKSSNVFVAGYTEGALIGDNLGGQDAFVVKLAADGSEQWRKQFGGSDTDFVQGMATDQGGNVLLVGMTRSDIGGSHKGSGDAFVVKYSPTGEPLWKKQLGTNTVEQFYDAATDSAGNVYAVGFTAGVIGEKNLGLFDGLLVKFDPNGEVLWIKQFGSSGVETAWDVVAENNGHVLVVGNTSGTVAEPNQGSNDVFLIKFDQGGNELWKKQIGTSGFDEAYDLTADGNGNVFVTGMTEGDLFDTQKGVFDAFVVRYR